MSIDARLRRLEQGTPAKRATDAELQERWERFVRAAESDDPPDVPEDGGPTWAEFVRAAMHDRD